MTTRNSPAAPILAALAIVLLPLGAYVGGYFGLSEWRLVIYITDLDDAVSLPEERVTQRCFRGEWQAIIFQPAACVESWVTGQKTVSVSLWDEYN